MKNLLCAASVAMILTSSAYSAGGDGSPFGSPSKTWLNINGISTLLTDVGIADINGSGSGSGFVYPKGSGKTAVYCSGLLWGGTINGEVRVGGSAYRSGLQAGRILAPGIAEDPNAPHVRIYRVRPDYLTADLSSEVADEGTTVDIIRAQYALDWNEWPAASGAPFEDVNDNGVYDPATDIPGVQGASQTIWFIANDLDVSLTTFLYGSNPIGVEVHTTIWALPNPSFTNVLFKRFDIINKSGSAIDSMYIAQWMDADVGSSSDDLAGCDTTLALTYAYNATNTDARYTPLPPPAVGYTLLQGPVVPSAGDTAFFFGRRIPNARNLGMNAAFYFVRGNAVLANPPQGAYEGTIQFYRNSFQGRIASNGQFYADPQGHPTRYALHGDPVNGTGWIDGSLASAGDRIQGLSTGPFSMAPNDTQEVILAEIAAGATDGVDRLQAISLLKYSTGLVRSITFTGVTDPGIPASFSLSQNYPNPFNPSTRLIIRMTNPGFVRFTVHNTLGQLVRTTVEQSLFAGDHELVWDGRNAAGDQAPSGVYFFRVQRSNASGSGTTVEIRKGVLLR